MRLIVIKQAADLKALGAVLLKQPAEGTRVRPELSPATLEQLKTLNPHVNFQQVDAGTVLLLPDLPELRDAAGEPLVGTAFEDFAKEVGVGMVAVCKRIGDAAEAMPTDQKALQDACNTEPLKTLINVDLQLQAQLAAANKTFASEQEQAKTAEDQVRAMGAAVANELAALALLIR
jgi:hypothetical protein